MSSFDIVRAWKDVEYRQSLSAEEQALLPTHPAGAIELTDEELPQAAGGVSALCLTYVSVCDPCTNIICPTQTLTE